MSIKRAELTAAAKLLGLPASGKNEEILARIEQRLILINAALKSPELKPNGQPKAPQHNPSTGVRLATGRKPEDGRRGLHPITGEVIYG